jgi:hypothetical protein
MYAGPALKKRVQTPKVAFVGIRVYDKMIKLRAQKKMLLL